MSDARRQELLDAREAALCQLAALDAPDPLAGDDVERALVAEQREFDAHRRQSLRARVVALDVALERLADGSYGLCLACGGEISAPRLRVFPAASRCIECAAAEERAAAQDQRRATARTDHPEDEAPSALPEGAQ